MNAAIHGQSRDAIKQMHKVPGALEILWVYASRTNHENVAWPTIFGLHRDTGMCKTTVAKRRKWLVEHKALEPVEDYVRPEWRDLDPQERARKVNLDKSEYFRPTGFIEVNGKQFPLLYFGQVKAAPMSHPQVEDPDVLPDGIPSADVPPDRTPTPSDAYAVEQELNTSKDSIVPLELKDSEITKVISPAPVDVSHSQNEPTPSEPETPTSAESQAPPHAATPPSPGPKQAAYFGALAAAFGYDTATMPKTLKSTFGKVAKELREIKFPVGRIADLHQFTDQKAQDGQWKSWGVTALLNQVGEFLKANPEPQFRWVMEPAAPYLIPRYTPPPDAKPAFSPEEGLALLARMRRPLMEKFGGKHE